MTKIQNNIQLRDYQEEAIAAIVSGKEKGLDRMGILLPTGTGKSIIQAALIQKMLDGGQAAFVVPFDHLIDNALKNLHLMFSDDDIGIVKAKHNEFEKKINIVSIQTALREKRMADLKERYSLVVVDEMHLFLANKFMDALNMLKAPDGICVGFSATILREDRKSLSKVFGQLVYHKSLWEMIAKGWLAPLRGIKLNAKIDLNKIKQTGGDYDDGELASILSTNESKELLFKGWLDNAGDRVTIAFTPTIAMAIECAEFWSKRGVKADWVCGSGTNLPQKEMQDKIDKFCNGETQILFNAAKLIVGFDHPPIGCTYIIRPTKSQSYYCQMAGRGTRKCSDTVYAQSTLPIADKVGKSKTDCIILDVGGVSSLGLVQFPELFDLPDHVEREAKERLDSGKEYSTDTLFKEHPDLFTATGLVSANVSLVGESKYSWVKTSYGWILSLGGEGEIRLEKGLQGFTIRKISNEVVDESEFKCYNTSVESDNTSEKITFTKKRKAADEKTKYVKTTDKLLQVEPIPMDWAMALAEDYVRSAVKANKRVGKLVDKNASWREQPLSEKQFFLLTKHLTNHPEVLCMLSYKTYNSYYYQCPDESKMTKGRAGELYEEVRAKWSNAKPATKPKKDSKY